MLEDIKKLNRQEEAIAAEVHITASKENAMFKSLCVQHKIECKDTMHTQKFREILKKV